MTDSGIAKGTRDLYQAIHDFRYPLQRAYARFHTKYFSKILFVHINKTGGSSIEAALGLPFQHRTALEIRQQIGEKRWEDRFSFAFVRNPWDKVASHYRYRVKTNQTGLRESRLGFSEWVRRSYGDRDPQFYDNPLMFMPQLDWITDDDGRMMLDFIGRFERLADDFREVCNRIGVRATLPHLKSSGGHDYRELYDETAREVVAHRFARDVEYFGYTFGDS